MHALQVERCRGESKLAFRALWIQVDDKTGYKTVGAVAEATDVLAAINSVVAILNQECPGEPMTKIKIGYGDRYIQPDEADFVEAAIATLQLTWDSEFLYRYLDEQKRQDVDRTSYRREIWSAAGL